MSLEDLFEDLQRENVQYPQQVAPKEELQRPSRYLLQHFHDLPLRNNTTLAMVDPISEKSREDIINVLAPWAPALCK
jgi:hypothetical protein